MKQQEKALSKHIEYTQLQNLELSSAYANLRTANEAHEQRIGDLVAVREAVLAISRTFDQKRVMDDLIEVMTDLLRFDRAMVLVRDRENQSLEFGAISHPPNDPNDLMRLRNLRMYLHATEESDREDPLLSKWMKGVSLHVEDPSYYFNSRLNWVLAMVGFNNFYSVPLMLGNEFQGVLLIDNYFTRQQIKDEHRRLVDALATNISITLENARLYYLQDEQLQQSLQEARILEQIDRELADTLQLDIVLELLMDWAIRFTNAHMALVMLVNESKGMGQMGAYLGCSIDQLPGGSTHVDFPLDEFGITGRAALTGETQIIEDVHQDSDYLEIVPEIVSQISVPVKRQKRVVAVITMGSYHSAGFTQENVVFAERL
ncbi:MAG TPA: GAF domain-containing protein, partial [Aggregatilineales bacterium]|nr:GAF domain-containing protein [Aggregatilineales bacterium]